MKHHLTGLDHPVIAVRDMHAARAAYQKLGFIVPPRGRHPEWGTGNWCIQFPRDYIELRGVIEPTPAPPAQELLAFLSRREGLMGIAFGSSDAGAARESFVAAGLHPREVRPLTRDFELPDGTVPVSFRLCFLPREETPGLMHVVVCEHLTAERLRQPEWLKHANGARRVAALVAVAEEPESMAAQWTALFARVERIQSGLRAAVGDAELWLLTPTAFRERYPGEPLPPRSEWPCPAAVVLEIADRDETRDWLIGHGVGRELGERLLAPAEFACGALLEFTQGRSLP